MANAAMESLSPGTAYSLKSNIAYPGTSAQATALLTQAAARLVDAYGYSSFTSANLPAIRVAT